MGQSIYQIFSRSNPQKVLLHHELLDIRGSKTIWTPLVDDFTVGISNNFSSEPDILSPVTGVMETGAGVMNEISKAMGGSKSSTQTLKSTIVQWQDSTKPTFSFRFMFPSLRTTDTPLNDALKVLELAAPGANIDENDSTGWLMDAPGHYAAPATFSLSSNFEGTWTLKVADYAVIGNLVMTGCSMQISKERVKSGQPLWVALDIQLEPAMMTPGGTIMNWFGVAATTGV